MKKKVNNNLPKEINNESANPSGSRLTVPIHKDYFGYFGTVKQDNTGNIDVEMDELGYDTPHSLIYDDNIRNRQYTNDKNFLININSLTDRITQDRFKQMSSCCLNGFMNSFIRTVTYEFEQKGISKEYLSIILSGEDYENLSRIFRDRSNYMIPLHNISLFAINIINAGDDIHPLVALFETCIDDYIAIVYDAMHKHIMTKLFGVDPSIIVELLNVLTRCTVVFHDSLSYSVTIFLKDLLDNTEFILAHIEDISDAQVKNNI